MKCILCEAKADFFETWRKNKYYKCQKCSSIFLDPKNYINYKKEKERYEEHNNDVYDKNYQNFVWPLVKAVLKDYTKNHRGLDFGAGTGPVITKLLKDQSYNIKIYDPFFANYPEKLGDKYDYIVVCEVVEHFHNPLKEFKLLKSLLKPGGSLYIKTELYSEAIDFLSWTYKNDITHVFFYHEKALKWIKSECGFSELKIEKDFIKYIL